MVSIARVLSVDDEEFIAETIRRIISREEDLVYVGSLGSADQLARCADQMHANLVVLDLNMPGKDPFVAMAELRQANPRIRIVILSGDCDPVLVRKAITAGAAGFISKDEPLPVIASELRRAAAGETAFSPRIRECMAGRPPRL